MVLLSGEKLKGEQQQQVCPSSDREREPQSPGQERPAAEGEEDDNNDEGEEDENAEDEGEEDYEEYEDFSELPDTRSIASDDSFYPPGGDDDEGETWSLGESESESPEPLTLFRACCTNNAVLLKALIRQGPEEEEVCKADRNRRVRHWPVGLISHTPTFRDPQPPPCQSLIGHTSDPCIDILP